MSQSFARYTPPIVPRPQGSDLVELWQFLYRLAAAMGLRLELHAGIGEGLSPPGAAPFVLDMSVEPTSEEMLDMTLAGSRVPLSEVRASPAGVVGTGPGIPVAAKDPGWTGRLDVGNELMMRDLADLAEESPADDDPEFPFRLMCRRMRNRWGTPMYGDRTDGYPTYNPLSMHPDDAADLGLADRDVVQVQSKRAAVLAVLGVDETMRRGTVTLSHHFGGLPGEDEDVMRGANVNRLLMNDRETESYSGQPRMSNVAVRIDAAASPAGLAPGPGAAGRGR
jgi:hypothetical protein